MANQSNSQLTFSATEGFRKKLLVRNLEPYAEGYKGNDSPGNSEFSINDVAVLDAIRIEESQVTDQAQKRAFIQNQYGPEGGFNDLINIRDIERKIEQRETYYTFVASTYNSLTLLTTLDPMGSNGRLAQDSTLAQIAGNQLKTQFQFRVAEETYQQTLGRVNILDALGDPFDVLAIATGNEQLIESDWKISVPNNIVGKGLDFISRISGIYSPYSWIPGSYFGEVAQQSSINQASGNKGEFSSRGTLLPQANKKSSDTFISNTGRGQTKRLFKSISLNVFAPDYTENSRSFGLRAPAGNYYVGSKEQELTDMVAPAGELPTDQFGNKVRTAVRGYGEIAKLYETKDGPNDFKFGLNGSKFLRSNTKTNSNYDAPRLQGGFTWTSTDSDDAAGRFVSEGGGLESIDVNFKQAVQSSWEGTVSTQYTFTQGSILDDTQRLVYAADQLKGDARLQHVGNAINQVSKVFNDGTREMTKGSRVYKYEDQSTGEIKGIEYCRVFTKDIPYFSNDELQKSEGITTKNRKFTYSVLDNTYNLNIAPWRGNESTNIQDGKVKKYMFSIENLAWRTSSKPGFTVQDLPSCERGPNGGRIMWFPPYDMKVSEQNSADWTTNQFLGRPEPIYTYNYTTRQGNLNWKIVVDHPSILNAIVDKELDGKDNQKINDIVDSFFAGCRKYDIYELAQRFPQFTLKDIYDIVTTTQNVTDYEYFQNEIQSTQITTTEPVIEEYTPIITTNDYSYSFYFDNDVPGPQNANSTTTEESYSSNLSAYILNQANYYTYADEDQKEPTGVFFQENIFNIEQKTKELCVKIKEAIDKGAIVNIKLEGSASSPNSDAYNLSLSKRRVDSVKKYILSFSDLDKHQDKLNIIEVTVGENTNINGVSCSEELTGADKIYSTAAMGCRAVSFATTIEEIPPEPNPQDLEPIIEETIITETVTGKTEVQRQIEAKEVREKRNVAKIIVKKLLTECDYFNKMKEDSPQVYQGIKDKLSFFHPTFHSITPEGLNSRLTFLQQCLRPGDTIPVIGEDGKPRQGDIKNTAFGSPPICILRIGDFYHTKIVIQQMSINYEPLTFDLNPEGIGVQPMIADINMSFNFIGGQGLKEPVSRLQNAVSFNYFGNTEIYDERSVPTEDTTDLDRSELDKIEANSNFTVKDGKVERTEEAGETIGQVTSTEVEDFLTGDINYKSFMKDYVLKSQAYVQNVISSLETISRLQSKIGVCYFTQDRLYTNGTSTGYLSGSDGFTTRIFGKPIKLQDKESDLKTKLIEDIDNNLNPFLKSPFTNIDKQNFKNSDVKKFKKNLKSFINLRMGVFQSIFNSKITDLLNVQTDFVRQNDISNLITANTDGYKNKTGSIDIFELSGSSTVDPSSSQANTNLEMIADIQTVAGDLEAFYNILFDDELGKYPRKDNLYQGFLSEDYDTEPQTRFCTASYFNILNDPESVKKTILGEELILKEDWVKYINEILYGFDTLTIPNTTSSGLFGDGQDPITIDGQSGLVDVYKELKRSSDLEISSLKSGFSQKFTLYNPFNLEKERNFTYIQKPQSQADSNQVFYFNTIFTDGINSGTDLEFNGKYTFN
jgi:outer membrane protein OmpA-like peptidoglycan-associated protein